MNDYSDWYEKMGVAAIAEREAVEKLEKLKADLACDPFKSGGNRVMFLKAIQSMHRSPITNPIALKAILDDAVFNAFISTVSFSEEMAAHFIVWELKMISDTLEFIFKARQDFRESEFKDPELYVASVQKRVQDAKEAHDAVIAAKRESLPKWKRPFFDLNQWINEA